MSEVFILFVSVNFVLNRKQINQNKTKTLFLGKMLIEIKISMTVFFTIQDMYSFMQDSGMIP